jgi:hypothetical protein
MRWVRDTSDVEVQHEGVPATALLRPAYNSYCTGATDGALKFWRTRRAWMERLYFGTDDFESKEFHSRKVIDEIKMVMSAFDCVLPDDAGIYCSSDITTGKGFYYDFLHGYGAHAEDELIARLGQEKFKEVKNELVQANVARGVAFSEKLRERGLINVVAPGPFFAKGFDQQHYLYLWEWFIIKKVYQVWFNQDWQYSNGCTLEYAIAATKGVPCNDHEGGSLPLARAVRMIEQAHAELTRDGFVVNKLRQSLRLLESLEEKPH